MLRGIAFRAAAAARSAVAGARGSLQPGGCRKFSEAAAAVETPTPPSGQQLRTLFIHSAVPFVAFGFVDNSVLIHAGDMIDNTVGLYLGLPTLAAAAMGQVFSDTTGVLFGNTIEAMSEKFGVKPANLTPQQHGMRVSKLTKTAGCVVGVVTGCCLGMLNLLIIDVGAKDRAEKEEKLNTVFDMVIREGHEVMGADRASLFIVDREKHELWSKICVATDPHHAKKFTITLPLDAGVAGHVAKTGETMNCKDAYDVPFFSKESDLKNDYRTRSLLCAPVKDLETGEVVAVVQMVNKKGKKGGLDGQFTKSDEELIKMIGTHVAIFMQCLEE